MLCNSNITKIPFLHHYAYLCVSTHTNTHAYAHACITQQICNAVRGGRGQLLCYVIVIMVGKMVFNMLQKGSKFWSKWHCVIYEKPLRCTQSNFDIILKSVASNPDPFMMS